MHARSRRCGKASTYCPSSLYHYDCPGNLACQGCATRQQPDTRHCASNACRCTHVCVCVLCQLHECMPHAVLPLLVVLGFGWGRGVGRNPLNCQPWHCQWLSDSLAQWSVLQLPFCGNVASQPALRVLCFVCVRSHALSALVSSSCRVLFCCRRVLAAPWAHCTALKYGCCAVQHHTPCGSNI